MRSQRGFTLLELMVAMAIFAILAVAGWQVFDSVNRARERAQFHADNLAVLQYAYLQLQQDMGQIVPYQAASIQQDTTAPRPLEDPGLASESQAEPFMQLNGEQISFIRFADPDPRYQSSPSIQRVAYIFTDEQMIRRQYTSIDGKVDDIGLDSVLLKGVTQGQWQALLPEMSTTFPSTDGSPATASIRSGQKSNAMSAQSDPQLLPKGVKLSFTYEGMPISWQWALTP